MLPRQRPRTGGGGEHDGERRHFRELGQDTQLVGDLATHRDQPPPQQGAGQEDARGEPPPPTRDHERHDPHQEQTVDEHQQGQQTLVMSDEAEVDERARGDEPERQPVQRWPGEVPVTNPRRHLPAGRQEHDRASDDGQQGE